MSRILRRPMFRGGPVSSYGTGIASGLADGGRVGLKKSFKGTVGQAQANMKNKKFMTGGDIVENINRYSYFDPNALPGFSSVKKAMPIVDVNAGQDGGQQLGDTDYLVEKGYISDVDKPMEEMSMEELIDFQIGEKGDVYQTGKSGHVDDKPREVTSIEDLTEDEKLKYRTKQMHSTEGALSKKGTLPGDTKNEIDTSSVVDPSVLLKQNTDDAELSLEEIKEALGSDKARAADMSDWALQYFAETQKGKDWKEAAGAVAENISSKPSRTEVINKEAAGIMLKDKLTARSDKRKVDLMKSEVDYKIKQGKNLSIAEGVLACTKGTSYSDRKVGCGIQAATSENTGEKYKYKGVTDSAGLKANISNGNLNVGDTVIVKETIKVKGQPDKVLKKIVEVVMKDGKLDIQEVYNIS